MRGISARILAVGFSLVLTNLGLGQTSEGGATGLAFLKVGVGGRATGLGEAYTAVSDDATAAYWNPAGLASVSKTQLAFTHTEWIQDISSEFVAFAFPAFKGAMGLSIYSNNVNGIERRLKPSDKPLGTIEAHDLAVGVSYGHSFSPKFKGGVTVKYLYEKIFLDSAAGFALDFGVRFQPFEGGFGVALTAQNLGSMGTLRQESIELPRTVRVGLFYRFNLSPLGGGALLLAADIVKVLETDLRANFGAELRLQDLFAFRFGYQTGFEEKSFGGGLGVLYKRYHFDYGYIPFNSNLGDTHRFSFGLDL